MKWFKHFSNAHTSESLDDIIDKFGFEGYGRYWRLLEYLSEIFDGECVKFRVHKRTLRDCMRFRSTLKLRYYLVAIGLQRGYNVIETDNHFEIEAPILLELKDRDFKNMRKQREQSAPKREIENKIKRESNTDSKKSDEFMLSIVDSWNRNVHQFNMPQIKTLSAKRKKLLKIAIKEFKTLNDWKKIFAVTATKGFTKKDQSPFIPNWDYIFRNENYIKFFEEYEIETPDNDSQLLDCNGSEIDPMYKLMGILS